MIDDPVSRKQTNRSSKSLLHLPLYLTSFWIICGYDEPYTADRKGLVPHPLHGSSSICTFWLLLGLAFSYLWTIGPSSYRHRIIIVSVPTYCRTWITWVMRVQDQRPWVMQVQGPMLPQCFKLSIASVGMEVENLLAVVYRHETSTVNYRYVNAATASENTAMDLQHHQPLAAGVTECSLQAQVAFAFSQQ